MSPEAAEEAARTADIAPLVVNDWTRFHPMDKYYWTPAMAGAWIVWRDLQCVAEFDVEFLSVYQVWGTRTVPVPSTGRGAPRMKAIPWLHGADEPSTTLLHLELMLHDANPSLHGNDVMEFAPSAAIRKAAEANKIEVTGIPAAGGERKVIPSLNWPDLVFEVRGIFEEYLARRQPGGWGTEPAYSDVLLPVEPVLRLWPERHSEAPRPTGNIHFSSRLKQAFRAWGEGCLATKSRAPLRSECKVWATENRISQRDMLKERDGWPNELKFPAGAPPSETDQ